MSSDPLLANFQEWIGVFMQRSMRNFIHYSKESGLSMSQIGAMFQIRHGRSNVSDLGERLGITNAAVSQLLEPLVQSGLIQRTEDPQDRRIKPLVLTEKGEQILQEGIQARQGWLEDLVSSMTKEERDLISAALRVLVEKTNQLNQHPEMGH